MRRIVAKNKFNKNNRIYAYYGTDGEMVMVDTNTSQPLAYPMSVENAPIQLSSENAPVLVSETSPTQTLPIQTSQSTPILVAEGLSAPTPTQTPNIVLPTITYSEPLAASTSTQQSTTQQPTFQQAVTQTPTFQQAVTQTPTQNTVLSTAPKSTVIPTPMSMGGGGGGGVVPTQSKVTTTTQTTPSGTVTKQTVIEPAKKEMSTGMKVGLGILVLVAGYMVYKNKTKLGF